MSVTQAERFAALLQQLGYPWNRAWGGGAVVTEAGRLASTTLPSGLQITLLSPTYQRLRELAERWERELAKQGMKPGEEPMRTRSRFSEVAPNSVAEEAPLPEATFQAESPAEEVGSAAAEPLSTDLGELAVRIGATDRSIANGSSIAFLAEYEGRSVLIGADAFATDLEKSIQTLVEQRGMERLPLDAFVVSHMGSRHNMTVRLLGLIDCRTYLFGTDGRVFKHPDRATVAAILLYGRSTPDQGLTLVFNYRTDSTDIWDDPELKSRFNYETVFPLESESGVRIEFAIDDRPSYA